MAADDFLRGSGNKYALDLRSVGEATVLCQTAYNPDFRATDFIAELPQPGLMTRQRCLCSPVRLPYSPLASIIGPSSRARLPRDAKPVTLHAARTPEPVTTETYNAGYQFSLEAVYSGRGAEVIRRQGRKRRNALD
jgi:hypothetical protein